MILMMNILKIPKINIILINNFMNLTQRMMNIKTFSYKINYNNYKKILKIISNIKILMKMSKNKQFIIL